MLEANPLGNPAAFFNDARGGGKPNIKFDRPYIRVDNRGHLIVAIVTTRCIPKGSELVGSYGDESFWMVREQTLRDREALLRRIRSRVEQATHSMAAFYDEGVGESNSTC